MNECASYDRDFFERQAARSYGSARAVLARIMPLLTVRRVVDVGCGVGTWLRAASELGAAEVLGVDGDYVDRSTLYIDPASFIAGDLAHESLGSLLGSRAAEQFDMVLCLEVAEHLPFARSASLVKELTQLGDIVVFSAAVPFQYGTDHQNEQWQDFWAILFRENGYECWDWLRSEVWFHPEVDWWYAQNLLVFARKESTAAARLPTAALVRGRSLSLVHPQSFLDNLLSRHRSFGKAALGEELEDLLAVAMANRSQSLAVPLLRTVERAQSFPGARDVFPRTRLETDDPEADLREMRKGIVRLENLRRANMEQAEQLELQVLAERAQVLAERARSAELERQLATFQATTIWRATWPLRMIASRMPPAARRAARGGAKLLWWTATGRLWSQLAARRQQLAAHRQQPSGQTANQGLLPGFSNDAVGRAADKLRRFEPFRRADYITLHPAAADSGLDPALHFLCHGAEGDKPVFQPATVAKVLGRYWQGTPSRGAAAAAGGACASTLSRPLPAVAIYVSSLGNVFMRDIAEDLAADLREAGADVVILDEEAQATPSGHWKVFVAPHEFFWLGRGPEWLREDIVADSIVFNTEQVQTPWFQRALPALLMARGVIDICAQTADMLSRAGVKAVHLPPGARIRPIVLTEEDRSHPLFAALPRAAKAGGDPALPFGSRPLDLAFFGTSSPHRERFFARAAPVLAEFETFLYSRPNNRGPILGTGDDGALARLACHVSANARITLNIHRDEFGYFEWHRMVRIGMCSGSLLVSEPCLPHPFIVPGQHYFEEQPRYLPDLIEWLLSSSDGREAAQRVIAQAGDLMRDALSPAQSAAGFFTFAGQTASEAAP